MTKVSRILGEENPFRLSWSHYVKLMRIENEVERKTLEETDKTLDVL